MNRVLWNVIGFVLRWPQCKSCKIRLTIHDRSEDYCNAHCDDDLGLGEIANEAYQKTAPVVLSRTVASAEAEEMVCPGR